MTGALLVDVHGRRGKRTRHIAHPAGVIEVDVGDRHAGELLGPDPDLVEGGEEDGNRRLAPGLDEHGSGALDQITRRDPLPPAEQGVDLEHTRCDRLRHGYDRNLRAAVGVMGVQRGMPVAVRMRAAHPWSSPRVTSCRLAAALRCRTTWVRFRFVGRDSGQEREGVVDRHGSHARTLPLPVPLSVASVSWPVKR